METVKNVSAAKPKTGGAIWIAPEGSTLPTDASTELDVAFKCLGFISDDGLTNSNAPEADDIKAWGGKTVYTVQTDRPDTFQSTLIESMNEDVLKFGYGDANVTVSDGKVTVKAGSSDLGTHAFVIEVAMANGAMKRIVIPMGKLTDLGDISYKDDELVGYEVTITALPDNAGYNHYEYITK